MATSTEDSLIVCENEKKTVGTSTSSASFMAMLDEGVIETSSRRPSLVGGDDSDDDISKYNEDHIDAWSTEEDETSSSISGSSKSRPTALSTPNVVLQSLKCLQSGDTNYMYFCNVIFKGFHALSNMKDSQRDLAELAPYVFDKMHLLVDYLHERCTPGLGYFSSQKVLEFLDLQQEVTCMRTLFGNQTRKDGTLGFKVFNKTGLQKRINEMNEIVENWRKDSSSAFSILVKNDALPDLKK